MAKMALPLLLLLSIAAGQTICYTGYVMDMYCIERGTLLDAPKMGTLQNPAAHTVHCLVDVPSCEHSDYNLLQLTPSAGSDKHCRAYKLDSHGKSLAVALARSVGICSTCDGTGSLSAGFSATVVGTADGSEAPVPLAVSAMHPSTVSCTSLGLLDTTPAAVDCEQGQYQRFMYAHGALMMTGWGVLLPSGIMIARFLKHRDGALWFKLHVGMQISGLVLTFIGWVLALYRFDVLFSGARGFIHGVMGVIVMSLGLLQPINALVRPHAPAGDEPRSKLRLAWELLHKISGYSAALLALFVIYLGTTYITPEDTKSSFQIAYFCMLGMLALLLGVLLFDNWRHPEVDAPLPVTHTEAVISMDEATSPATKSNLVTAKTK